ncbi:MAG: hypothetical protein PHS62_00680 [Patescibacteria group bacterium]|nr:hypothetical protein [Patescibacteria group bacterium]
MNKNWKAICKIADTHVMWALAMLDVNSTIGRKFVRRFPEYFTKKKQAGPYPLSLMRAAGLEKGCRDGSDSGDDHIVSYDAVPEGIPVQTFDKFGRNVAGLNGPKLPSEISPDAKQGEIVTWAGKQFVVLENNNSCEELSIAPAELVAVDR